MRPDPQIRPTLWDGLVVLAVVLLALGTACLTWLSTGEDGALTAVVTIDGAGADRVPLAAYEERVYQAGGYTLTVAFSSEGVRVLASDCPSQDCVHTGTIRRGGQSIVCLPARLTVRLEGGGDRGVDAVLG